MNRALTRREAGLIKTMLARRAGWRERAAFGLIYALAFLPVAGLLPVGLWLGANGALMAVEVKLLRPERRRGSAGRVVMLALLGLSSFAHGSLALFAVGAQGQWGVICGGLFLAGAVMNAAVANQRSPAAYVATLSPYALYLLALAAIAWALSGATIQGVTVGVVAVMLVFSSVMIWRSSLEAAEAGREAREEARRRRRAAEALAEAKSAMLATIGHELRTPISAILAGASAIRGDEAAPAEARANADLIARSGEMMTTLLGDLLDLAKLEARRMRVEVVEFDLCALIDETLDFWRPQARAKGLKLRLEAHGEMPDVAWADPTRLRQVLNNLFSNAIKFTEAGEIVLALSTVTRRRLRFQIRDSGRGMTPDQLERLFTPFDQTADSTARTHGGTGLGLSISREFARLMGGDLTAESQAGRGSTFTLEIESAAPAAAEAFLPDLRILAVDDHEVNRRALALMLEPMGVALTTAESAGEALQRLSVEAFDLVLMDLNMPGMGGLDALAALRAGQGPNRRVPVVACTAADSEADIAACRAAGMAGLLAKPIRPAALQQAIAEALRAGEPPAWPEAHAV